MRRPVIFVVLAGLAAVLASVVVYSALKKREAEVQQATAKNVQIVVAAYDLPLGTKIEPGELKMTRWSGDSIPPGAMSDPKQAVGSFVKSQFVSNEPIVASKLFQGEKTAGVMPLLIPFGMRAVSVQVDEVSDVAGFVLPHTRVDMLVAISGGDAGAKPFSKLVLQNVEVLAVAQEVEMKKDEPEVVKVVTVLVSPQEAERLALASREGVLRLAMRNYNDNKIVLTSGTDVKQMLNSYSLTPDVPVMESQPAAAAHPTEQAPRRRGFEVEIYRNGKSSESVSFVNEASLSQADAPKPAHREARASLAPASETAASEGTHVTAADSDNEPAESASHDSAPAAKAARGVAPASNGVKPASAKSDEAAYVPTPKILDVP